MSPVQKVLKPENKIVIFVDNREFNSKVAKELARLDCIVKPKQLEVGDYILSDRVCVERKSSKDFLASIFDQRIFAQLGALKDHFEKPILIIEGQSLYCERNVHPNALRGVLTSIAVDYSIPILWTENEKDTAGMLYWIAKREQIEEGRSITIRGEKRQLSLKEQQEFLVAGLPKVNTKIAKRLLEYFKSPEKVFTASEEELKKVKGIGAFERRHRENCVQERTKGIHGELEERVKTSMSELFINVSSIISPLCYSIMKIEPYTSCSFNCAYCYARWYREQGKPEPKHDVLRDFLRVARIIYRKQ